MVRLLLALVPWVADVGRRGLRTILDELKELDVNERERTVGEVADQISHLSAGTLRIVKAVVQSGATVTIDELIVLLASDPVRGVSQASLATLEGQIRKHSLDFQRTM